MRRIVESMSVIPNLARVLARRHSPIDAAEFLEILAEATDSTDTLTVAGRAFLAGRGGVPADALDPANQTKALQHIAASRAAATERATRDGYTTNEVAQGYGLKPANIRREVARRGLYTSGRGRDGQHVFPRWQFTDDGPLSGLRQVLAALPDDYHPLDVADFMTTPNNQLGERSPAEWLSTGGQVQIVVELAGALGYE